jgi:lipooligosaccharide transport system ATP-binding protein
MENTITAANLVRRFGNFEAVRGIAFSVPQGRCIGLLGPNGAGKTTTMRMIMGLSAPTSGDLHVFGTPVQNLSRLEKARIGLVPQEDNLDPDLSVQQNLEIYGRYFGLPIGVIRQRVPLLLEFMRLEEKAGARVTALSGGMKRRLVIARALIADPDLVILDEPTTGLDPQARVLIWQRLLALKAQGKTLLLTTHYMDEAQRLCDSIIIMDGGRILDQGSPAELIARHVEGHVFEIAKPLAAALEAQLATLRHEDLGDAVVIYTDSPADMLKTLGKTQPHLHRPANLEDVFLKLTGRTLRNE